MRDRSIVPAYENKSKGTKFTYHINNQRGFIIVKSRHNQNKASCIPVEIKNGQKYNSNTDFHACMNQITCD